MLFSGWRARRALCHDESTALESTQGHKYRHPRTPGNARYGRSPARKHRSRESCFGTITAPNILRGRWLIPVSAKPAPLARRTLAGVTNMETLSHTPHTAHIGHACRPPRETVLRPRKPALHEEAPGAGVALASMLGGCVVVPARPAYYRPAPNYYYYPAYPGRTTIIVTAIEPRPALTPEAIMTRPIGFPSCAPGRGHPVRHGRRPAQTYAPPPAPAYDASDPANANLAPVDRSPTRRRPCPSTPSRRRPPTAISGARLLEPEPQRLLLGAGRLVLAPYTGALWTPGYWGFVDGIYLWHAGYWGPHIGFYGGINYGFGYIGIGFVGGYWDHDRYFYNRAVTNVNVTHITNVYAQCGGQQHRQPPHQLQRRSERHPAHGRPARGRRAQRSPHPPTAAQRARSAGADRGQFFEHNQGARRAPSWNTARTGRRLPARWRTESRRRPARRSPQRFRLPQHQHRAASGPEPRRPRPAPERARRAAAGPRGAASPAGPGAAAGSRTGAAARMQRPERGPDNLAQPMHNERQRGRRWKRPARSRPARRRPSASAAAAA